MVFSTFNDFARAVMRRVGIGGKMNVMTIHFLQTAREDRADVFFGRAVIEVFRRRPAFEFDLDLDGMTLTGADFLARFVKSKTLLVVGFDRLAKLRQGKTFAVSDRGFMQSINAHPAVFF